MMEITSGIHIVDDRKKLTKTAGISKIASK